MPRQVRQRNCRYSRLGPPATIGPHTQTLATISAPPGPMGRRRALGHGLCTRMDLPLPEHLYDLCLYLCHYSCSILEPAQRNGLLKWNLATPCRKSLLLMKSLWTSCHVIFSKIVKSLVVLPIYDTKYHCAALSDNLQLPTDFEWKLFSLVPQLELYSGQYVEFLKSNNIVALFHYNDFKLRIIVSLIDL